MIQTDEQGQIKASYTYDPYGNITSKQGTTDTIFKYSGKYGVSQEPNNLLYMRSIYYQVEISRFTAADSYEGNKLNILSQNRYTYVEGNPINYIDPLGLYQTPYAYSTEREGNIRQNIIEGIDSLNREISGELSKINKKTTEKRIIENIYGIVTEYCDADFAYGYSDAFEEAVLPIDIVEKIYGEADTTNFYLGKIAGHITVLIISDKIDNTNWNNTNSSVEEVQVIQRGKMTYKAVTKSVSIYIGYNAMRGLAKDVPNLIKKSREENPPKANYTNISRETVASAVKLSGSGNGNTTNKVLKNLKSLEELKDNPKLLKDITPDEMYNYLKRKWI